MVESRISFGPVSVGRRPSIKRSVHVHFPALLEQPPVGRVRKRGLVYPKLAQSKGSGDRIMHSPDLFWGNRRVSQSAASATESKDAVPIHLSSKPALPETGFFAFVRNRRRFDWLIGGKLSPPSHASSSSPHFGLGFGGPLHARRCNAPVIEDARPSVPPTSRPVFLLSTPVSSYSSGTSASSRGSGNSSVSVAFGVRV